MKGVKFVGPEEIEVKEFPDPRPGEGEVIVQIKVSSLCRSDMSLYHGTPLLEVKEGVSVIPGHEPCGVVVETGPGVPEHMLKVGDRVAVYLAIGCGHCPYCRKGLLNLCPDWQCIGFDIDGGHAEKLRIPAINCLKIPDKMSFAVGALSTDKAGTLYHAQKRLSVSARDNIVIFGMGPMGLVGVCIAHALGATVIAVDLLDERLEMAKNVGADYVINGSSPDVVEEIKSICDGAGVDVGIDCTGNGIAQSQMLDSLKKEGRGAFIGEGPKAVINPSAQFIRKRLTVIGSWYFPIHEYEEVANFIIKKKLPLEKLISHVFKLDDAPKAFETFDKRETRIAIFSF